MAIASLAWNTVAAAEPKIQVVYDEVGVAVINISDRPQDITSLSFQGETGSGTAKPLFEAAQWEQRGLGPVAALAGGACYQLINPSQNSLKLDPGEAPAKPSACQFSQGWLLALDRGWRFWTSENGGENFRVLYAGQLIKTCKIAQGKCQFTLPKP
jgi:hypothetical protein